MPRKAFDPSSGVKRCPKCKQTKPLTNFGKSNHTLHGYSVYCRKCNFKRHEKWRKKNLKRAALHSKQWREANPRLSKDHKLKSTYGIPLGTYGQLFTEQQGRCAICRTDTPNGKGDFHLDHVKGTGLIRGLLCHHCNVGLGLFRHDPKLLLQALEYIRKIS